MLALTYKQTEDFTQPIDSIDSIDLGGSGIIVYSNRNIIYF